MPITSSCIITCDYVLPVCVYVLHVFLTVYEKTKPHCSVRVFCVCLIEPTIYRCIGVRVVLSETKWRPSARDNAVAEKSHVNMSLLRLSAFSKCLTSGLVVDQTARHVFNANHCRSCLRIRNNFEKRLTGKFTSTFTPCLKVKSSAKSYVSSVLNHLCLSMDNGEQ